MDGELGVREEKAVLGQPDGILSFFKLGQTAFEVLDVLRAQKLASGFVARVVVHLIGGARDFH